MSQTTQNFLPAATGQDLGNENQRWDLFAQNVTIQSLGGIEFAAQYPGADAGEQIAAAIEDLPVTGGIIHCAGITEGTISTDIFSGVTKPVHLAFSAGTMTVTADLTTPANVAVEFPIGSELSIESGNTVTFNGPFAAGPYAVFAGDGSVIMGANSTPVLDPMWWGATYSGSDDQPAIQKAVNAVGAVSGTIRTGKTIRITGKATLGSTLVIARRSVTIDCGGVGAFNLQGSAGFVWAGTNASGTDPMIEVKGTLIGTIIRNCRFYGKTANKPRAAISYVMEAGFGQIQQVIENCVIGRIAGDTGFEALDTFVDGIRIGDTYDSGTTGNNDTFRLAGLHINGCTGKGIRLGATNNILSIISSCYVANCAVGVYAAAGVSLQSVFFGNNSTADIQTPVLDDFAVSANPSVNGLYVASEGSARFMVLDGPCKIHIIDGYWSMAGMHADGKVILADNGYIQSITIRQYEFLTSGVPPWSIVVKNTAGGAGVPSSKVLDLQASYPGAVRPTLDVDPVQPLQQAWITNSTETIPAYVSFPQVAQPAMVCNSLVGIGDTYNEHRYDIPTDTLRIGERVNGSGVLDIKLSRIMLTTTAAASVTATALIPANVLVIGITAVVFLNAGLGITGGATTVRLGTVANPTKWWTVAGPVAGGTEVNIAAWNLAIVGTSPYYTQAAEDVVLSVNAGTFTAGGQLLVTAAYIQLTPSKVPSGGF